MSEVHFADLARLPTGIRTRTVSFENPTGAIRQFVARDRSQPSRSASTSHVVWIPHAPPRPLE